MELPDPNSYPRMDLEVGPCLVKKSGVGYIGYLPACLYCERPEYLLNGKVDAHIMGCAFRSRWWAIWHHNKEQERQATIDRIEASLKKMDGDVSQ